MDNFSLAKDIHFSLYNLFLLWILQGYVSWCLYPLTFKAFWYTALALLICFKLDESSECLLRVPSGVFLIYTTSYNCTSISASLQFSLWYSMLSVWFISVSGDRGRSSHSNRQNLRSGNQLNWERCKCHHIYQRLWTSIILLQSLHEISKYKELVKISELHSKVE